MSRLACIVGACFVVACSGRSSDTGGDTEAQDDGAGSSTADATGGGEETGAGSTSVAEGDETGAPPVCDPSDSDIGPAVSVTITNAGQAPIHLAESFSCLMHPPFTIQREGVEVPWAVEPCVTCTAAVEGSCGCPGACAIDSVIRIEPGGIWQGQWTGAEAVQAEVAAECAGEFCSGACQALLQAPAGEYVAVAVAGSEVDCEDFGGCECLGELDPAGWCSIAGVPSGVETTAQATIAYPAATSVELVFR